MCSACAAANRTTAPRVRPAYAKAILACVVRVLLPGGVGLAGDDGRYRGVDPALRNWVQGLRDKTGHGCCETADGHPAEFAWDFAGNRYKVRIEGEWYDAPDEAVIDAPNRFGYATVWYWWEWQLDGSKTHHIRRFLPGPGG